MSSKLLGDIVAQSGGALLPAAYHTTRYNPVGLWQGNGDLLDASGNGLTLSANAEAIYGPLGATGLRGIAFSGVNYYFRAFNALLQITGALTVEMLCAFPNPMPPAAGHWFFTFAGAGELEANNYLYSLFVSASKWGYLAEQGAGGDINYDAGRYGIPQGKPFHLAMTRSAGQVLNLYQNGNLFATSGVLAAPTGGGTSTLQIGASDSGTSQLPNGTVLSSIKICASELSAAQILGEYQLTIGR